MSNFISLYRSYIKVFESMLDINRSLLDPNVFEMPEQGQPKLINGIKGQIIQTVRELEKIIPVHSFYVVGSILTNRYNDSSDIDVNIQLDPSDLDSISLEDLLGFREMPSSTQEVLAQLIGRAQEV